MKQTPFHIYYLAEVPGQEHRRGARGAQARVAVVGCGCLAAAGVDALDDAAHVHGGLLEDVAVGGLVEWVVEWVDGWVAEWLCLDRTYRLMKKSLKRMVIEPIYSIISACVCNCRATEVSPDPLCSLSLHKTMRPPQSTTVIYRSRTLTKSVPQLAPSSQPRHDCKKMIENWAICLSFCCRLICVFGG